MSLPEDEGRVIGVLLAGVGGQGTVLAGKVLARVALQEGLDVKVSEIHGMSQRGGNVVTQVRFGPKVWAPTIAPAEADFVLAFEKLEALRCLPYLRPGGWLLVSDQRIDPMPVLTGTAQYPSEAAGGLPEVVPGALLLQALEIARECGSEKATNMVMLGALATRLPFPRERWLSTIAATVPSRWSEANQRAFNAGMERGRGK